MHSRLCRPPWNPLVAWLDPYVFNDDWVELAGLSWIHRFDGDAAIVLVGLAIGEA